ncbi:DUF6869 domain-containing protein [Pseudoalteromonas sp. GB56]
MEITEKFILDWIEYNNSDREDSEENHYTDDFLIDLVLDRRHAELWDFVIRTYDRDLTDTALAVLAAGALEDALSMRGELYISQVEELCKTQPRFKKLLAGVWRNNISQDVWDRMSKVKGEPW